MKRVVIPALIALLSGCADSLSLPQNDPSAEQFYTLDTQNLQLCRGNTKNCLSLTLIAVSLERAGPIERAYNTSLKGPNYPVSLAKLLISPPNQSYSATPLSQGKTTGYRLPINAQTNSVWNVLHDAYQSIYSSDKRS